MMDQRTPFKRARIEALREQFKVTARKGDRERIKGIAGILREKGHSEEDIVNLYVEATLHVDDVPEGFIPDLDAIMDVKEAFDPHPNECACPACKPVTPK